MATRNRIEETLMLQKTSDGKDEMNLAEFPLCALSNRLRPGQKTFRFEDRIADKSRDEWITRRLTITGSDAYGLPTALDDEVLLGLIQLTRQRDFADRKVPFTRHELIRLLDWRDDSKNYHRLEESLNRWMGVTLYYQKAWWNRARKCWVDEKFHVLDNVWLCHRGEPPPDTGLTVRGVMTSAFVWNDVIFRSFNAGNLKSIDFEFFKSLNSAVAKRLYRFLDKRFWHRSHCEFKLKEFACQHIGLSNLYDTSNLKRKLLPGIRELEDRAYLRTATEAERFRKLRAGEWLVRFTEGPGVGTVAATGSCGGAAEYVQALTQRGVSQAMAEQVCSTQTTEAIQVQLRSFDWLMQRQDKKISRNPAGFLVSSIRNGYGLPKGFPVQNESHKPHVGDSSNQHQQRKLRSTTTREVVRAEAQAFAIEQFWKSLSESQKLSLEQEALNSANPVEQKIINRGGAFANAARKNVLDSFAIGQILSKKPPN